MPRKIDILYICDWLPPDFGAVGQYSLLFARDLAHSGKRIVLAGLSSVGPEESEENYGAGTLQIVRFPAQHYKKSKFTSRLWWTAKINTRLILNLRRELWIADEIRFTGSPPLFLHWIAPLNLLLKKRLVYRITDFHPECLIAARGRANWWLELTYRLTLFWRRRVSVFEVLGEDQRDRLLEIGIDKERIQLKRDRSPVTFSEATPPLDRPKLKPGNLLLLYSGNWGVAHDFSTFLQAYRLHHSQGSGRVILWLNAVGSAIEAIDKFLCEAELPYRRSYLVPIEQVGSLLVTPDAHLITLSDAFVGFVLPSKVYGCIASNKPILFVGSERSDVHQLCVKSGAFYRRVAVGDIAACVSALENLADHASQTRIVKVTE